MRANKIGTWKHVCHSKCWRLWTRLLIALCSSETCMILVWQFCLCSLLANLFSCRFSPSYTCPSLVSVLSGDYIGFILLKKISRYTYIIQSIQELAGPYMVVHIRLVGNRTSVYCWFEPKANGNSRKGISQVNLTSYTPACQYIPLSVSLLLWVPITSRQTDLHTH